MSQLPLFKSDDTVFSMLQTKWKSLIDPLLGRPQSQSIILPGVSLQSGSNVIPHKLGRRLVGWNPIRVRASATIYDTQDSNQTPNVTLQLTSSAAVVIDLEVF